MNYSIIQTASATLRISGPDANTYLQGQFTQELRVSEGKFAYGFWLNQKGRMLADSHVLRLKENDFLVHAARTAPEVLRRRLEDYLIADEVEIADESSRWCALELWGDGVGAALAHVAAIPGAPQDSHFAVSAGAYFWPGRLTRGENYILLVPRVELPPWEEKLKAAGLRDVGSAAAERVRLCAGRPAVPDDIGPDDLPNEGGLEEEGISYTKGCYLGQEVMARLKNLGQVRRRLFLVRGCGEVPAPRTALHQGVQRVGEIRSGACDGAGFIAFAMLSLVTLDRTRPLSLTPDGPADVELAAPHG